MAKSRVRINLTGKPTPPPAPDKPESRVKINLTGKKGK